MKATFEPGEGCILIDGVLEGPAGSIPLLFSLDTGSTITTIGRSKMIAAGYDPDKNGVPLVPTSASGQMTCMTIRVAKLSALGTTQVDQLAFALDMPESAMVDGLLGLNFFADCVLTIDFRNHTIDLT